MRASLKAILTIVAVAGLLACNSEARLMEANETSAILRIKTIQQAEIQYYAASGKYAASLQQLKDLIPPELVEGKSNGYLFTLAPLKDGFAVGATPETLNGTGRRTFYSDESLVIRSDNTAQPANAASPEFK